MAFNYAALVGSEDGIADTWREIYDDSLSLPWNIHHILQQTVLLPYDFYDVITAYFLLPSALCRVVPYMFFYGQSGSGKSTIAKIASYLHGIPINSSSDTFAAIRNTLSSRRYGYAKVCDPDDPERCWTDRVIRNTCMVWDDINAQTFTGQPNLYNMLKFGTNKSTSKIIISSLDIGENIEFDCFCPKIFSSITPLHLDDRFRELKRRMIVIPCKRVEELSDKRKQELRLEDDTWQGRLLDLEAYEWSGFSENFEEFWDMELAQVFLDTRKILSKTVKGLTSQERSISIDLLTTGIVSGIWQDEIIAVGKLKAYWSWFKNETRQNAGLGGLLKDYIKLEERNANKVGTPLAIPSASLRNQIDNWVALGWLLDKPKSKEVKELMLDLGMRLQQGNWKRG